jgi:hypothetical protein
MSRKTSFTILFLSLILNCFSQNEYNQYFKEGSLRYDLEFVGNADTLWIVPVQTKILKSNAGCQASFNDDRDLGFYRFTVFDIPSGVKIFQKGFSPIFQEWLLTPEAKKIKRSFYQALYFPCPVSNVIVDFEIRNEKNDWVKIYSDTILLSDSWIKTETPTSYPIDTIRYSGSAFEKIDVVILSEGYTVNELEKFRSDSRKMIDTLLNTVPFNKYRDRFNFYSVQIPSEESGSDMPDEKVFKNTAFNSSYFTFDSPRYLTTPDLKSVYDATDGISWDHLAILVNSERYGGGGFYNFLSISSTDNVRSPFVFIHEFAHSFAGLGDEYFNTLDSLDATYNKDVEPWEPNLTTLADFNFKWKKMVDPSTPIPTPRDSIYSTKVGVFEGGGYLAKGVYSPAMSCWMKEYVAGKFCPVCQEGIKQAILKQSK